MPDAPTPPAPDPRIGDARLIEPEPATELDACTETVERLAEQTGDLKEENEQLRRAAGDFSELAERLHDRLLNEGRGTDE
jgi:predicted RNase H-like nuclease (RuvC/YqgF family)